MLHLSRYSFNCNFLQLYHHYHYHHNLLPPQWRGVGWREAAEVIPRLDKVLHHKENEKKTGAIRMESKRHINYHARQTILKKREKKYEAYILGTVQGHS